MKKIVKIMSATALLCAFAYAKDYEVKMLDVNDEGTMVFEPGFIHIQKGDSITFVPTHKTHWAKSVIVPEGASKFESKLDEKATFKFDTEGVRMPAAQDDEYARHYPSRQGDKCSQSKSRRAKT